jgi:rod shape-determining protein MreC
LRKLSLVLIEFKHFIVLTILIIISLIILFSNDNTQVRFLRALAVGFYGTIQSGFSAIPNVFKLEKENKLLRENNIKLANEIANLKESKLENIRLSKLLNLKEKSNLNLISGKIINKSLIQTRNFLTLNIGENDSVRINMTVITDQGLVGRIISTSRNYSIVQILYNKDLKISVKCQRTRLDGILNYDGVQNLTVTNILKNADVLNGDVFITSEYSSNFPSGIPVGTVSETGNLDNIFKKITLKSNVNFELLEEVFVLKYLPDKEKTELEKKLNLK